MSFGAATSLYSCHQRQSIHADLSQLIHSGDSTRFNVDFAHLVPRQSCSRHASRDDSFHGGMRL